MTTTNGDTTGAPPTTAPLPDVSANALPARIEWALLGLTALVELLIVPHGVGGDGYVRYETLMKLVENGQLSPARYSIVQSLVALPWYLVGKLTGDTRMACAFFNVMIFFATLVALFRLLRTHVDIEVLRRWGLFLVAASMFGCHIRSFYTEVLSACAAMLGIAFLVVNKPRIAGVFMIIATVNMPAALVALVFCNGLWALRTRRFFDAAWPVVASALLIVFEMVIRRGWPPTSGYEGDAGFPTVLPYSGHTGFSYPIVLGVISLLFSFGKGIVFFAPGVVAHHVPAGEAKRGPLHEIASLSMAYSWGLLIAYAPWWSWYGGWFWGPRFLLFACFPASLALAWHLSHPSPRLGVRLTALVMALWSIWVGVDGLTFQQATMDVCQSNRYQSEFLCWYVPEFSALFRPFIAKPPIADWAWPALVVGMMTAVALTAAELPALLKLIAQRSRKALSHHPSE